jgi:hypothetical protein
MRGTTKRIKKSPGVCEVAHVVEHLPNMYEAPSSNPTTTKNKQTKSPGSKESIDLNTNLNYYQLVM